MTTRIRGKLCLDGKRRTTRPNAHKAIDRIEGELLSMIEASPAPSEKYLAAQGRIHRLMGQLRNLWNPK